VLGILFSASPARGQDSYRVIVNVANPIEALTKSEAARLFLTRTTWDSGEAVAPVDLAAASPVREDFSRDVLGITTTAAVQHWNKAAGEPPASMATDREVLAFVRLKRRAIGYVSSAANVQGVKVVAIVKAPSR
jgi:ABC-type phosphate transport system substrate-binding protein